jgi:UDP-3-O-[3-hydroxymyristoyl] N-acetylglucosamine deacetylase/3-hydroxyacyl-[acyl-carrier-protein] dehydratase
MNVKQSTIGREISVKGVGLHSGKIVNLTLCPAEKNEGIVFQRVDLEGSPKVPALVQYVVDTARGTVLSSNY